MRKILTWMTALSLVVTTTGCQTKEEVSVAAVETSVETQGQAIQVAQVEAVDFIAADEFSNKDYETAAIYDEQGTITLKDGASSVTGDGVSINGDVVTITQAGSYTIKGTLSDGQIVVDAGDEDKIQLRLDGVSITNSQTAAISVVEADKVFVSTIAESTLSATIVEDETSSVDAALFSKADLTLNGTAQLTVISTGNGVTSKDDLVITSGTYVVQAGNHGLEANNSIRIAHGSFVITAQKDGLHCEHDEDTSLGYLYIVDGMFQITAQGDGMDASGAIEIEAGTIDMLTGGGSALAPEVTSSQGGGMGGGMAMPGNTGMSAPGMNPGITLDLTSLSYEELVAMLQQTMGFMLVNITEDEIVTMLQSLQSESDELTGSILESMSEAELRTLVQDVLAGVDTSATMQMPGMEQGVQSGQGGMSQGQMTPGSTMERTAPTQEVTTERGTMTQGEMGMNDRQSQMGTMPGMTGTTSEEDDTISTKGIKANGVIVMRSGTFTLDTYDDAIHSNLAVYIEGGTFVIATGDDAVKADYFTSVSGGTIGIDTCYEGLEGHIVSVSGGDIRILSLDDGINAVRSETVTTEEDVSIKISGGYLYINSYYAGDGLDSNGTIEMTGGDVLISSTTVTTDTALDYGVTALITGGSYIATGSTSQTRQNFGTESTQGSMMVDLSTVQSGTVTLSDANGNVIVSFDPVKEYQTIHISCADLVADGSYPLVAGTETQTIQLDGLVYGTTTSNSMGGGMTGGLTGGMQGGRR